MAEATDIAALPGAGTYYGVNPSAIAGYLKRGDLALAIGIMAILVVLFLPLPPWLLDIGLAFSLSFADSDPDDGGLHRKPLEFSSFPTVLLITTLMRLSLNLATTRLILATAMKARRRRAMSSRPSASWSWGAISSSA